MYFFFIVVSLFVFFVCFPVLTFSYLCVFFDFDQIAASLSLANHFPFNLF